jgi:hypothetical protein
MSRPLEGDFGDFYRHYISLAVGEHPTELIKNHSAPIVDFIQQLLDEMGDHAYAPGKWTIKQMIQHLLDSERIFVYRLVWIARGDSRPLPGFDENMFADAAPASHRTLQDLKEEFRLLRRSTCWLIITPRRSWKEREKPVDIPSLSMHSALSFLDTIFIMLKC